MTDTSPPRSNHRHRLLWLFFIVVILAGGGWYVYNATATGANAHADVAKHGRHSGGGAAIPVSVATAQKGDIEVTRRELGTVTPLANITVRTQIAGQLLEVGFQEGQIVQKGDFLAQIDPRPYQTSLEQAEGALQRDQALLKDAELNLVRYRKLVAENSLAKQQADTQASLVGQYQGNVVTDQGQIDAAKLNLVYCHVVAPITGRVGLRQVDAGNYVQTSDANGLVTLTQLQPISVIFTLPEDDLPAVARRLKDGAELAVTAYDRTQANKIAEGKLISVDNQIDTSTGTVKMRAQFDNSDNTLFPNQFVNADLLVDTLHDAIIVPSAAVLRGTPGTYVYKVVDDNTVKVTPVKLGQTQGDKVAITDGLSPGDQVVIDGTDKLKDGGKISIPDDNKAQGDKTSDDKSSDDKSLGDKTQTDKADTPPAQGKHHGQKK
jgi:multidrug efflux system membrane fusion protein